MRNALEIIAQAVMLAALAVAVPLYRLALPTTLRARWLRVVKPVPYLHLQWSMHETRPWYDVPNEGWLRPATIMPGLVGESYLTLCVGRRGVRDLITVGDVLVTTESYAAPPYATTMHRYRWPDQT